MKYFVVCGNLYRLYGPFSFLTEAQEFIEEHDRTHNSPWSHEVVQASAPPSDWKARRKARLAAEEAEYA